jgi:predicted dinucleotide-binding enzyme
MTTNDDPAMGITVEHAAALARVVGLTIPDERLPRLAAELTAAQALIAEFAAVPTGSLPAVVDAFNPAWQQDPGARRR